MTLVQSSIFVCYQRSVSPRPEKILFQFRVLISCADGSCLLASAEQLPLSSQKNVFSAFHRRAYSVCSALLISYGCAHLLLSVNACLKCFPVWEISAKWSYLSAQLLLVGMMVSPRDLWEDPDWRLFQRAEGRGGGRELWNLIRISFELIN